MVLPKDVSSADNGVMRADLRTGCGVVSTFSPHRQLEMHHTASIAMRAMVAEMCKALGLDRITGTGGYRTLARQIQMFDGTDPSNRTDNDGRYIPEPLWHQFAPGELDVEHLRHWKGKKWRRRKRTADAAAPGESNHGLGLAVDFDQGLTDLIHPWLVGNAARFGFDQENPREDWHWRYHAGDKLPAGITERTTDERPEKPPDPPKPTPTTVEENDMRVIDLNPNSPEFARLVIAGRIKWVRGVAAASVEKMKIDKIEVQRDELIDLMRTFGTEGDSPFGGEFGNAAPDGSLNAAWIECRR